MISASSLNPQTQVQINANERLCEFAKLMGFNYKETGICAGVAMMGVQAFLCGDLPSFDQRIIFIFSHSQDELKNKIHFVTDKLAAQHSSHPSQHDELTPEEQGTIDVMAFLDGVMFHQMIEFQKDYYIKGSDETLDQAAYRVTASQWSASHGGVHDIQTWYRRYNKEQFVLFLSALQETVNGRNFDIAFYWRANDHAIAYCYDAKLKTWLLINANSLPSKILRGVTPQKLADRLYRNLFNETHDIKLKTTIFVRADCKHKVKSWLNDLETSPSFQYAQTILFREMRDDAILTMAHEAACCGYTDVLNQIAGSKKRDILKNHYDGFSLVYQAAARNHPDVITMLGEAGVNLDDRSCNGFLPITAAAFNGSSEAVEILASRKANLLLSSPGGWNAALYAAEKGFVNVLKVLLKHGVDLSQPGPCGKTPMQVALKYNQKEVVAYLNQLNLYEKKIENAAFMLLYQPATLPVKEKTSQETTGTNLSSFKKSS